MRNMEQEERARHYAMLERKQKEAAKQQEEAMGKQLTAIQDRIALEAKQEVQELAAKQRHEIKLMTNNMVQTIESRLGEGSEFNGKLAFEGKISKIHLSFSLSFLQCWIFALFHQFHEF